MDLGDERRLQTIGRLQLLERVGDPALTALTRLAAYVTGARAAAVHILDDRYERRIAAAGAPLVDHPVADSLCREAVRSAVTILCSDATADPRFAYSSLVRGESPIRFYVAVPLRVDGGTVVGTLCAFDSEPRVIFGEQTALLEDVARQVETHIELVRIAGVAGEPAVLDPATGALSQVMLGDRLARALGRRDRDGRAVLVAVVDLADRAASNNGDRDDVLRALVTRLRDDARVQDTIGRLDGDRFALVAELPAPKAGRLMARMRRVLDADARPLPIGVVLAGPGDDASSVLRRAADAVDNARRRRFW
jgi:GAF domain-containing protein